MDDPSSSLLRSMNWAGSIPIVLYLAPTSLSSPTMPQPIHCMVSRMTYLHIGLHDAVLRLYKFAPAILTIREILTKRRDSSPEETEEEVSSETNKEEHKDEESIYPMCWFEDLETGTPLRWHLFVGVLYDLLHRHRTLPWKLRIHFTSYPTSLLSLPQNPLETVRNSFRNGLKQALYLQHGSSKRAMSMSKQRHEQIWDAIRRGNYEMYQEVSGEVQVERYKGIHVPVRVMIDGKPMVQHPFKVNEEKEMTLGYILSHHLPHIFQLDENDEVILNSSSVYWAIQGLQPPLSCNIVDLWSALCYPDHFLYITVSGVSSN